MLELVTVVPISVYILICSAFSPRHTCWGCKVSAPHTLCDGSRKMCLHTQAELTGPISCCLWHLARQMKSHGKEGHRCLKERRARKAHNQDGQVVTIVMLGGLTACGSSSKEPGLPGSAAATEKPHRQKLKRNRRGCGRNR